MSKYKFKINFYFKGNYNNSLTYDLYDNCAVDDFIKTVEYGSDIPVYNTSMVFSKSETANKWCELYSQAKQLTKTNVYDKTIGPIDPELVMKGYNQSTLNYLHNYVEEFEYLIGNIADEELAWLSPIISKFNDNIHYMENDNVGFEGSWLSFRMEPFKKIPKEDFPEPDKPVITVNSSLGIDMSIFFKLCWRAPLTLIYFIYELL